jgi:phosphatidylglycerophosphatase A
MTTAKSAVERAVAAPSAARWSRLVGTFFGIGLLRPGPGTWASAVTVALWRGLGGLLPPALQLPLATAAAAAATIVGIPAATRVARTSGKRDPSCVVIDEVAGQMLTLIGAPIGWKSLMAGLILFRAFDIVKPFPLRRLERLPGGVGIVFDDLGAGLYALVILQLMLHYGWLV